VPPVPVAVNAMWVTDHHELTPVERYDDIYIKRDDLYTVAGVRGGKARTCRHIIESTPTSYTHGVITGGARKSPQVSIVANIAKLLGVACRVHVPDGPTTPEIDSATEAGAEVVRHRPGYNSVIDGRAKRDAHESGWTLVPFGMRCAAAVTMTAGQVGNIPDDTKRIIMAVGSGMSLAGVIAGLGTTGRAIPVVGVVVGADPRRNLDTYSPWWEQFATLVPAGVKYQDEVVAESPIPLDPIYEAKAWTFTEPGDLFWAVGHRDLVDCRAW